MPKKSTKAKIFEDLKQRGPQKCRAEPLETFYSFFSAVYNSTDGTQKLVAFLLSIPILETLTGRGVSRVIYEVPQDFQQVWYKLDL